MKRIDISSQIFLEVMDFGHEEVFFKSIYEKDNTNDNYRKNLQEKYKTIEAIKSKIDDAVNDKRLIDGTPDFFIFYDDQLAGVFEFHPLSSEDHIEVGYWLYEEFRGNGILSSVFPSMIDYARENFSKNRILATTSISNIPSQKLLEKMKFLKTGKMLEFTQEDGISSKEFEYIFPLKNKELSLIDVDESNLRIVQDIFQDAPTYQKYTQNAPLNDDAAKSAYKALPPNCSRDQKDIKLIYEGTKPIGVFDLILNWPEKDKAHIGLLLLGETHQGKGVGAKSYLVLEDYIKDKGINTIRISVVESNPVEHFWLKMGFERTGKIVDYEGKNIRSRSIIMEKVIER